jgi:hypothetical protein
VVILIKVINIENHHFKKKSQKVKKSRTKKQNCTKICENLLQARHASHHPWQPSQYVLYRQILTAGFPATHPLPWQFIFLKFSIWQIWK